MNQRARLDRLEARDAFGAEPKTFAELAAWVEAGRDLDITPDSIWWPLAQAAEEGWADDEA